jgi:hypothetical protein
MDCRKSHAIERSKKISAAIAISAIVFSNFAHADISPAEAKEAIRIYCSSIVAAQSIKDIRNHWSVRFKQKNDDIEIQQRTALTPEVRSLLEVRSMGAMKEMAKTFPSKMTVNCADNRCVANAEIYTKQVQTPNDRLQSDKVVQTITLIKENGALLIDDSSVTITSKARAQPH